MRIAAGSLVHRDGVGGGLRWRDHDCRACAAGASALDQGWRRERGRGDPGREIAAGSM